MREIFVVDSAANLPPRLEAGEHAAGRQPGASPQDLRLWLLQGAPQTTASFVFLGFLVKTFPKKISFHLGLLGLC
jgi:hypothetical protein